MAWHSKPLLLIRFDCDGRLKVETVICILESTYRTEFLSYSTCFRPNWRTDGRCGCWKSLTRKHEKARQLRKPSIQICDIVSVSRSLARLRHRQKDGWISKSVPNGTPSTSGDSKWESLRTFTGKGSYREGG